MKQAILELKKKLLLVELKSDKPIIEHRRKYHTMDLIGKLTDITEEQIGGWVQGNNGGDNDTMYQDYRIKKGNFFLFPLSTAKESFFSYLEVKEIYFENKFLKPSLTILQQDKSLYYSMNEKWQEEQEKVWNINCCYIFEII